MSTTTIDIGESTPPPQHLQRTAWLLMLMMLLAVAGTILLKPTRKLATDVVAIDIATAVPREFGQWRVDNTMIPVAPSPDQQQALDATYEQIVSLTFVNDKRQQVMLSMAYGSSQKQGLRAHRQEVCYRAQGFRISDMRQTDFNILGSKVQTSQFVAQHGNRREPVTYWFTMGDHVVRSYFERQIVQLQYALSGYIPDGYLFRVSTLGRETESAYELQQQFTEELINNLPPELKRRLIGM